MLATLLLLVAVQMKCSSSLLILPILIFAYLKLISSGAGTSVHKPVLPQSDDNEKVVQEKKLTVLIE